MALDRTGLGESPRSSESRNVTKKTTGRGDGTGGPQKKVGPLNEESRATPKEKRRFTGSEPVSSSDLIRNPIGAEDVTATDASPNRLGAREITDGAVDEQV
jgi:hypothetical protein